MAPIEKRKVTMTSIGLLPDGSTATYQATDYVPLDILDSYVADAASRWQSVTVGESHDPGPAGDGGETITPDHLKD